MRRRSGHRTSVGPVCVGIGTQFILIFPSKLPTTTTAHRLCHPIDNSFPLMCWRSSSRRPIGFLLSIKGGFAWSPLHFLSLSLLLPPPLSLPGWPELLYSHWKALAPVSLALLTSVEPLPCSVSSWFPLLLLLLQLLVRTSHLLPPFHHRKESPGNWYCPYYGLTISSLPLPFRSCEESRRGVCVSSGPELSSSNFATSSCLHWFQVNTSKTAAFDD